MENTDVITDEEIVDIGTVIQLSPHARTTQFTEVQKNSEGNDLVSLDEIYVKTGQESINKIIAGIRLTEHGKLSIQGCEGFTQFDTKGMSPFPDKLNYHKGAEGFFTALKEGLVWIIKSVIKFIKGIYNWIVDRFKRLFGLEKTLKEAEYVAEKSDTINNMTAQLVALLGGTKEYDPVEMYNSLGKNKTQDEQFMIIKSRLSSSEDAITRIGTSLPAFAEAKGILDKLGANTSKVQSHYEREIKTLRGKFRSKDITAGDIQRFKLFLEEEAFVTLDVSDIVKIITIVYDEFYGIELKDLGLEGKMSHVRALLKDNVEVVSAKLNPAAVEALKAARRTIARDLSKDLGKGKSMNDIKMSDKTFAKFSDILTVTDAEFIDELTTHLPDSVAGGLAQSYAIFATKIRDYTDIIEITLKTINECAKTYTNIIVWHAKISAIMASYLTKDVKAIMEAYKKHLTDVERGTVTKDDKPAFIINMEKSFEEKYPGMNFPEDFSKIMVILQNLDKELYGDAIGNLIKSLRG